MRPSQLSWIRRCPAYASACIRICFRMRYFVLYMLAHACAYATACAILLTHLSWIRRCPRTVWLYICVLVLCCCIHVSSYYITVYMCPHTILYYWIYTAVLLDMLYALNIFALNICVSLSHTTLNIWVSLSHAICHTNCKSTLEMSYILLILLYKCVLYTTGYTTRWIRWYLPLSNCHLNPKPATYRTNYQSTLTLDILAFSQRPAMLTFVFSICEYYWKKEGEKKLLAEQLGRCPSQRGMTYGMPLILVRMHTHTLPHALFLSESKGDDIRYASFIRFRMHTHTLPHRHSVCACLLYTRAHAYAYAAATSCYFASARRKKRGKRGKDIGVRMPALRFSFAAPRCQETYSMA